MAVTLSYSSAELLMKCPQAYVHHKVLHTPPDYEEDFLSFRFGKAYHNILENTNHDRKNFSKELFDKSLQEQNVPEFRYPIYAAIDSYYRMHKATGLEVISVEKKFETETMLGYIDAVMIEPSTGFWHVVDLKTSAMIIESSFGRLTHDTQLNLYAGVMQEYLAKEMGLDINKFAGCRYRVVAKSKIVTKEGETLAQYAKRIDVKCLDIATPIELMNVQEARDQHRKLWEIANAITEDSVVMKNRSNCFAYNKPCNFFSKCYGKKFDEMYLDLRDQKNAVEVITKREVDFL